MIFNKLSIFINIFMRKISENLIWISKLIILLQILTNKFNDHIIFIIINIIICDVIELLIHNPNCKWIHIALTQRIHSSWNADRFIEQESILFSSSAYYERFESFKAHFNDQNLFEAVYKSVRANAFSSQFWCRT